MISQGPKKVNVDIFSIQICFEREKDNWIAKSYSLVNDQTILSYEANGIPPKKKDCSEDLISNLQKFTQKIETLGLTVSQVTFTGAKSLTKTIKDGVVSYPYEELGGDILPLIEKEFFFDRVSGTGELIYPDKIYITKLKVLKE